MVGDRTTLQRALKEFDIREWRAFALAGDHRAMTPAPEEVEIQNLINTAVLRHSVHFAHDSREGSLTGGSGTLISYRSVGGILTCAHVFLDLQRHAKSAPLGLVGIVINSAARPRLQAIHMTLQELVSSPHVVFGGDFDSEERRVLGPDLAFIKLPPNVMSTLSALGTPLELESQLPEQRVPLPEGASVPYWATVAVGVIGTKAEPLTSVLGTRAVEFTTNVFSGPLYEELAYDGFDRVRLAPDRTSAAFPDSLQGLSGGGMWAVGFYDDANGVPQFLGRRLVGVAYWQTDQDKAGYRDIIGHGGASIIAKLMPAIDKLS